MRWTIVTTRAGVSQDAKTIRSRARSWKSLQGPRIANHLSATSFDLQLILSCGRQPRDVKHPKAADCIGLGPLDTTITNTKDRRPFERGLERGLDQKTIVVCRRDDVRELARIPTRLRHCATKMSSQSGQSRNAAQVDHIASTEGWIALHCELSIRWADSGIQKRGVAIWPARGRPHFLFRDPESSSTPAGLVRPAPFGRPSIVSRRAHSPTAS